MKTIFAYEDLLLLTVKVAAILSALDAIALGPVPVTWIAAILPFFASVLLRAQFKSVPVSLFFLFSWAVVVQGLSAICSSAGFCSEPHMPPLSTTPYPVFIALRFLPFVMLISMLAAIAKLRNRQRELSDFVIRLGTWIAGLALYVYIAQLSGLPDIPRTRLGTDGMEVTAVRFSYAFHRALGTFREPSGMAVWLMLPFLLSLRSASWRTYLMGAAIVLSGSMTAFVAISAGAALSAVFLMTKTIRQKSWLFRLPIVAGFAVSFSVVAFDFLVKTNDDFSGLWGVISDRLLPVFVGGIEESNRGYVFEFAEETGISLFGYGLGNINLLLTEWQGGIAVSGILSLYLNILLGLGAIGLAILGVFLARPLLQNLSTTTAREAYPVYAAYFAWLTAFVIHSAEFPFMFSLTYGLVAALGTARQRDIGRRLS